MPNGYNYYDYRISYLKSKLDELGVNYLDNTDLLINKSETNQVFNIKYDAGHWNDTGAFFGINNIYAKLQEDGINVEFLDINDYKIEYKKEDKLPVSDFEIEDYVPTYSLVKTDYIRNLRYNKEIELNNSFKYYIETYNPTIKNYKLLFFRGSYMNEKEKFISSQFERAYFVHNYDNCINFDYYYNISKPDIVLFESVEYAIGERYFSSIRMNTKKYNELYSKYENLKQSKFFEINCQEIVDLISKNYYNKLSLTKITLPKDCCQYAYIKLNDEIYDFCYDSTNCYITLDTEELYSNNFEIILVSNDLKAQQIENIEIL